MPKTKARTEDYTRRDSFGRTIKVTRNIDTGETIDTKVVETAGIPGIRPPVDSLAVPTAESIPSPATPPIVGTGTSEVLARPAANAKTEEWATYAAHVGVEVPKGAGRDDIRAAVEAAVGPPPAAS